MSEINYQTDNGYYMAHKAVDMMVEMQAEIDRLKAELEYTKEMSNAFMDERNNLRIQLSEARAENEEYKAGIEVEGYVCMREFGASVLGLSSALLAYPHKVKVLVMKGE